MPRPHPVHQLRALARSYGPGRSDEKRQLLAVIEQMPRIGCAELTVLQDTLTFLRAFPDDRALRDRVEASIAELRGRVEIAIHGAGPRALVNTGLPGSLVSQPFAYGTVRQLAEQAPGCVDVDWPELEDETELLDGLGLLVTPGEFQGLEDIRITMPEWVERSRTDPQASGLDLILGLFARSRFTTAEREYILDHCRLPIAYRLRQPGTGRAEVALPVERLHDQRREIDRFPFPVLPTLRRPLAAVCRLDRAAGALVVRTGLLALCSRGLEIYPLIHASADDVQFADCGRGLGVALVGVRPEARSVLESLYFVLLLKNGVPIAYGPAAVLLGCCELGLNLFPEFRGGEVRFAYAQFMRVLHQLLGVETFFVTAYGMGEGNPEAIRTGAFWFYRKLGFAAVSPEVERLAREEEALMRADPGFRSSPAMLRRLSHTEARLGLGNRRRLPLDLGALGIAQTRYLARAFAGDRRRGERRSAAIVAQRLAPGAAGRGRHVWSRDEKRALTGLAPLLCMLPDFPRWTAAERRQMARFVRAKGGPSEAAADRLLVAHPRFEPEIRALIER